MPTVRKLTSQEVQQFNNKSKSQRKVVEEEYDAFLSEYGNGDYGEITLEPGESRLTIKNRFKAAAKRCGANIDFRRTNGSVLRFKITGGNNSNSAVVEAPTPEPELEPAPVPAPVKRKGGRPRKNPV